RPKEFAIVSEQDAVFDTTEAVRLFQNRVEHRREIFGRGVDDLQEFGDGGLPRQSLVTLSRAFFELRFEFGDGLPQIGKRFLALYSHLRASEPPLLDSYAKSKTLGSRMALWVGRSAGSVSPDRDVRSLAAPTNYGIDQNVS